MAFTLIENPGRTFWASGDGASQYFLGQLVTYTQATTTELNGAVAPLLFPSGAADLSLMQVPAGIVVGMNNKYPVYDTTIGVEAKTGVVSLANQNLRESTGQEGMHSKSEKQLLLQIVEIVPDTVIRGSIYNAVYGTAPTLLTQTSATTPTDGGIATAITTNACDFTNVANCGTLYCRSGSNAGLYRVCVDTSTTAHQCSTGFPNIPATGDTYVKVPFKQGNSNIGIGVSGNGTTTMIGMSVNCGLNPVIAGTNLFNVIVYKMDLSVAGSEYVDFRFGGDNFCRFRA